MICQQQQKHATVVRPSGPQLACTAAKRLKECSLSNNNFCILLSKIYLVIDIVDNIQV